MERKRRSSHRLRENSKPKFKNTAATAVDLDDDDDFVSPPREKELRSKRKFENAPSHLKLKLKGKISENPESKKNDTKKDKRKKVDSEYRPGLRRLSTRMKLGRICEAAAGLSPEQREAVEKMGLGTLLRINMDNLPGLLNYYLLDSYDDASDSLILQNTTILVTKQLISEIMGFEPSGLDFNSLPSCEKTNPILKEWKSQFPDKKYNTVENFEINSGGFGKRQSDLRDEEYPSEHDVDIDEMVKDFSDEEAFCTIVDIGFNKILKEKENMEIALSAGLAKFPESELLISWKNKIKHMFYGETDSEDIDSHDKGNESWNDEPYESPKKNEETDKTEDDIQPDDVYKTPLQVVNETRVDTSSMTASQFFDLPGVAEEVIQLVDKTKAEKDLKEKGKDVETKELKHYVRRKRKLPRNLKSPFISRVVSLSSNVISIEKDFCDSIFVSTRDYE
ncbi:hypothetical protein L1887_06921 [Cichorium endivia]|nr:hypothetical protein L1887_06921 [Cichorium endivia]